MKKAHEKSLEDLREQISFVIDPKRMSVAEAREFLQELVGDLQMQLDCLPKEE